MRIPSRFSYSAFSLYEKDPEEYYVKYLCELRAPRMPQERPAAVGSCFDAKTKAELHAAIFGVGADPEYSFEALFEAQVEEHNRDWVRDEGLYVFDCYKHSGAYQTLLDQLKRSIVPPRFEFTVDCELGGVPFTGKPDCRFVLPGPIHVVHDWKVNGYCSKSATSPTKGYQLVSDGEVTTNKKNKEAHKLFTALDLGELTIDANYMEDISTQWADQLSLYGWSLGEKVGDQNVVLSVHQVVAKPMPGGRRPVLRFAEFRRRVRDSYQHLLLKRFVTAWGRITSGHPLHFLTKEENDARMVMLDKESIGLQTDGSTREDFFAECVRPAYRG